MRKKLWNMNVWLFCVLEIAMYILIFIVIIYQEANALDCIRAMRRQRGYVFATKYEIVYIE